MVRLGPQCHLLTELSSLLGQKTVAYDSGSGVTLLSTQGIRHEYIFPSSRGVSALAFNPLTR